MAKELNKDKKDILNLETLNLVMESLPLGVYISDKDGNILYGNKAGRNIWKGLKFVGAENFEEYQGWWYDSGERIRSEDWALSRAVRKGETSLEEKIRIKCFDGSTKYILNSAMPLLNEKKEIVGAIAINQDITLRIHAEERFRNSLENLLEGCQILDFDWKYLYINKTAEIHNQRPKEELLGNYYQDMWPGIEETEVYRLIEDTLRNRVSHHMENEFRFPNGSIGWFELHIQPVPEGVFILSSDITQKKASEENIQNIQKLESLGYLAAGLAHDFNNLLGGIYGYIDLARNECEEKEAGSYLDQALGTINRARELTRQLLTFSKGGSPELQQAPLFPLVGDLVKTLADEAGFEAQFDIEEGLWECRYDQNQLTQVITNITQNAIEAMSGRGKLVFRARNCRKKPSFLGSTDSKALIKISLSDEGEGIKKENQNRIFNPFFSTRGLGRGLGLATCFSIMQRHGGFIDASSEPGRGSIFSIYLPAVANS